MSNFDPIKAYGLTALLADPSKPAPVSIEPLAISAPEDLPQIPTTPLARRIRAYVARKLPEQTYNHSLRVFAYGCIIAERYFPQFGLRYSSSTGTHAKEDDEHALAQALRETWFVTAMLHDIGTIPEHIKSTRLSYEFWAGLHARDILLNPESTLDSAAANADADAGPEAVATVDQMESIVEAIIRHQDVQDAGSISTLTRLIHIGTLMDNIGQGKELVHPETIAALNSAAYAKRDGWSSCFRDTVVLEKKLKPWAMVSRIDGFEQAIEEHGSTTMKEWDEGM